MRMRSTIGRAASPTYGFAFDVDGVLVRGPKVLPRATAALQLLRDRGVPLCFVTNGGGTTEEWRAKSLSKRLALPVSVDEVCLCHTPMQPRIDQILREDDGALLVVGRREQYVRELAASYGIPTTRAITPGDLHSLLPRIFPDAEAPTPAPAQSPPERFAAVLLFIDPQDWARELQICVDVLASRAGVLGTRLGAGDAQSVVLLNGCADVEYINDFPSPRLGAGAYRLALDATFAEVAGRPLQQTLFGKPNQRTFEYAGRMLRAQAQARGRDVDHFVMVGDNPQTDIAGANGAGADWTSVLVRTGVFGAHDTDGGVVPLDNDYEHPADIVVDDVFDAVTTILQAR